MPALRSLIIDNYDSYTFNLLQLWDREDIENVVVIRNDQFDWYVARDPDQTNASQTRSAYTDNAYIFLAISHTTCHSYKAHPPRYHPSTLRQRHHIPWPRETGAPRRKSPTLADRQFFCIAFNKNLLRTQSDALDDNTCIPILGVCLGHQAIGHFFGAKCATQIVHAPRIMHGRLSQVRLLGPTAAAEAGQKEKLVNHRGLFESVPSPFWAVRYHSLIVDPQTLPATIIPTAYCVEDDADVEALMAGQDVDPCSAHQLPQTSSKPDCEKYASLKTIMAFQHVARPLWGVQFHPESICTEYGKKMMRNFQRATLDWIHKNKKPLRTSSLPATIRALSVVALFPSLTIRAPPAVNPCFSLMVKRVAGDMGPNSGSLFRQLIERQVEHGTDAMNDVVWLDSAKSGPLSNFSYLSTTPTFTLTYSTLHRQLTFTSPHHSLPAPHTLPPGTTFFTVLSRLLSSLDAVPTHNLDPAHALPDTGFRGGLVGYLGYEMKRESLKGYVVPDEQLCGCVAHDGSACCRCVREPDAAFHFLDRFIVYDHARGDVWACAITNEVEDEIHLGVGVGEDQTVRVGMTDEQCRRWLADITTLVSDWTTGRGPHHPDGTSSIPNACAQHTHHKPYHPHRRTSASHDHEPPAQFLPDAARTSYLASIRRAVAQIHEGESYELCLTTHFRHHLPPLGGECSPLLTELYADYLRVRNPAPFAALMTFAPCGMSVLGASPERFLKVDARGRVEMKPVKGTVAVARGCICEWSGKEGGEGACDGGVECEKRTREENGRRVRDLRCNVKERGENLMHFHSLTDNWPPALSVDCRPHTQRPRTNLRPHFCQSSRSDPSRVLRDRPPARLHRHWRLEARCRLCHGCRRVLSTRYCSFLLPLPCMASLLPNFYYLYHAWRPCCLFIKYGHRHNGTQYRNPSAGSMTGAPKLRSVQILDSLEDHVPRGVYSGCMGYFSIGDARALGGKGTADFNVVIRTGIVTTMPCGEEEVGDVRRGQELSIGAGGAITFLSNPEREWDEVLLKSRSVAPRPPSTSQRPGVLEQTAPGGTHSIDSLDESC
ncbi:ADC synthase [Jimgerdemannia flammicorona]|uniref:aminodeoxychorismate synthase n=1 Tax=Jimgerdemannia flammicorona TaxID=994334 RepID=A0A433CXB9_9FUNG|nr:ADC synthase [Jimgerdemannia flammicorona]